MNENLTWMGHNYTVENKISKNIELLYQGRHCLDQNCLKQIYFAYIHAYLNNASIAWASTHKTKLKKVQSKQKYALGIIFNQSKTSLSEPLFLSLNITNIYWTNIFQSVQFMNKMKNTNVSHLFLKLFGVPSDAYATNFSLLNLSIQRTFLKTKRLIISARGPIIWNYCLSKNQKEIGNFLLSKQCAKEKIMELSTVVNFFQ